MPTPNSRKGRVTPRPGPIVAAYLVPFWPIEFGSNGIATYVHHLSRRLHDMGGRPVLITERLMGQVDRAAAPPVRAFSPERGSWAMRKLRRVSRRLVPALREADPRPAAIAAVVEDCVRLDGAQILEMEESFGWAAGVSRSISIPLVVRLHGPWFLNGTANGVPDGPDFRDRVGRELAGLLAAAAVSAPSRDVLERTRRYYQIPLEGAVVIPCPAPSVPEHRRWRLDEADRDTILFIGRFDLHKGGDVMIDAFAKVAEAHPRARLRFVGPDCGVRDASGRCWKLPEYIATRAAKAAAEGRIDVLGQLPASSLDEYRRRALVTVVPSRYDNNPNTVSEAAALGAPLVASDVGGIGEVVADGESALLVPPADPDALAVAIGRLLDDPQRAARLGAAAGRSTALNLDPDRIADRTLEFYRSVLDRRASAALGRRAASRRFAGP